MPIMQLPPAAPPRAIRGLAPLHYVDRFRLPVGQRVRVPTGSYAAVSAAVLAVLKAEGFAMIPSASAPGAGEDGAVYAEKGVRRVSTHASTRATMAVLVVAGITLGGVDGLLVGALIYAVPWFAAGFVMAGLIWWRYGRTFESAVIGVSVRPARSAVRDGSEPGGPWVVGWGAGQIRSVLFAGERAAVAVEDSPVALMQALAVTVHRFEAEQGLPPRSAPAPAPATHVVPAVSPSRA